MSPCSLNDMLHSSLIINGTAAAAGGRGLCVCFFGLTFFVIEKVLRKQFLIDQHVETVCFFSYSSF